MGLTMRKETGSEHADAATTTWAVGQFKIRSGYWPKSFNAQEIACDVASLGLRLDCWWNGV